jgi:molybdopterin synthase catalytic subunit
MAPFAFSTEPLDPQALQASLADPSCGGYAAFEGWVRDLNEGRRVRRLEYEAFEALAVREGGRIVAEACARFGVRNARCVRCRRAPGGRTRRHPRTNPALVPKRWRWE